jgi:hypothetical protein
MQYETNTWLSWNLQVSYHALTGGNPQYERELSSNMVRNAGSIRDLGISLHRLGDSYAHSAWEGKMYAHGIGHALTDEGGHWPDKIRNRPELYLKYVNQLANVLSASGHGKIDMFAFSYIAKSGFDTNENSAILETEVSIQQGIKTFSVFGNQESNIKNYLNSRNDHYGTDNKSKIFTKKVDRYYKDSKGKWQVKEETRTFVHFSD